MLYSSLFLALPGVVGPTPSSLARKWPAWYMMLGMFGILLVLNVVTLEIVEGLLSFMMLCLVWLIVRNGMQDAPKYVTIYGVLSVLNFFFDVVPLILSFHGRSAVSVQPGYQTSHDGLEQTTYIRTVKTTPFFDLTQGLMYNAESIAMIASPVCMFAGTLLAIWAQFDLQQAGLEDSDYLGEGPGLSGLAGIRGDAELAGERTPLHPSRVNVPRTFVRFQGASHKLTA